MTSFSRGDVVVVDLGMVAKVRSCVVVSVGKPDRQRSMSVVLPMTTEIRGGECEIRFSKPAWLRQEFRVETIAGLVSGNGRTVAPAREARASRVQVWASRPNHLLDNLVCETGFRRDAENNNPYGRASHSTLRMGTLFLNSFWVGRLAE